MYLPAKSIEKFVFEMPKVELHLHVEGAIPYRTLLDLIHKYEGNTTIKDEDDLRTKFIYTDFSDFIEKWRWLNSFLREEEDFEEIIYQVLHDLSRQNVKYVEVHYAQANSINQGLSIERVTEYLIKGKKKAEKQFGIKCELIADLSRTKGPDIGM